MRSPHTPRDRWPAIWRLSPSQRPRCRRGLCKQALEWYIEIDHDWSLKPGNLGRGLKKYLSPDLWVQVETTFVGPNVEENWEALFRTAALFRTIACAVATRLGYAYPLDLDRRTLRYLSHIKQLEP